MPFPLLSLLPLGAAAISGGMQLWGQHKANKSNRNLQDDQQQWNIEQFDRENANARDMWNTQNEYDQQLWRQQNLYDQQLWKQQNNYNEDRWDTQNAYNLKMWEMQNKYNSPQEQMARLADAGLNPHLMYGQGTVGNAGSTQAGQMQTQGIKGNPLTSNTMRPASVQGYNRAQMESVTRGIDVFGDMQRFKQLQAQTNNLEAQTDVSRQEALLKAQAQVLNALNIKKGNLDYGIAKELMDTTIDGAKVNLERLQNQVRKEAAETDITLNTKDERIIQAELDARNALETLNGKQLENRLRQIDINLQENGIQKQDNIMLRILAQPKNQDLLYKLGESIFK